MMCSLATKICRGMQPSQNKVWFVWSNSIINAFLCYSSGQKWRHYRIPKCVCDAIAVRNLWLIFRGPGLNSFLRVVLDGMQTVPPIFHIIENTHLFMWLLKSNLWLVMWCDGLLHWHSNFHSHGSVLRTIALENLRALLLFNSLCCSCMLNFLSLADIQVCSF